MSIRKWIKDLFRSPAMNTVVLAGLNAIAAAIASFDKVFAAIEDYGRRANHRYTILFPVGDDEAVANYTDPADFEPYTSAYLDGHTASIDSLTVAFDALTAAFDALAAAFTDNPSNPFAPLSPTNASLYEKVCDAYCYAADAYSRTASCAITTALPMRKQAVWGEQNAAVLRLEPTTRATPATEPRSSRGPSATKPRRLKIKARPKS